MRPRLPKAIERVVAEPTWPGTLPRELEKENIGIDYDTAWSRRPAARLARRVYQNAVSAPLMHALARPTVLGIEHLDAVEGPVIITANHTSHLDTAIVLAALPEHIRRKTVVAAAADYFFDRPWKAVLSALWLGAIPWDRSRVNRQSADIAGALIERGWNLVIFPEGGRSPDGWGQEFSGIAGYIAKRYDVPVVPIHLRGVRPILPKDSGRIRLGSVEIRVGDALRPLEAPEAGGRAEDARRFALRIERAVEALADEAESDWWSANLRRHQGTTPPFRGPEASTWRRAWALPESARSAGRKKSSHRPW